MLIWSMIIADPGKVVWYTRRIVFSVFFVTIGNQKYLRKRFVCDK